MQSRCRRPCSFHNPLSERSPPHTPPLLNLPPLLAPLLSPRLPLHTSSSRRRPARCPPNLQSNLQSLSRLMLHHSGRPPASRPAWRGRLGAAFRRRRGWRRRHRRSLSAAARAAVGFQHGPGCGPLVRAPRPRRWERRRGRWPPVGRRRGRRRVRLPRIGAHQVEQLRRGPPRPPRARRGPRLFTLAIVSRRRLLRPRA